MHRNQCRPTGKETLDCMLEVDLFADQHNNDNDCNFLRCFTYLRTTGHVQYISARGRVCPAGALGRNWLRCMNSGSLATRVRTLNQGPSVLWTCWMRGVILELIDCRDN